MRTRGVVLIALALTAAACGSSSPARSLTGPTSVAVPQAPPPPPPTPFQGVWRGTWARQQCSETGGFIGTGCNTLPLNGGLSLTLTQSGTIVQGTAAIGAFQLSVSGPVASDGSLALSGQGTQSGFSINITSWRTTISGNLLVGSFAFRVLPDDILLGTISVTASLQNVVKQ